MSVLNESAVRCLKGEEATEILQTYMQSPGIAMAYTSQPVAPAAAQAPPTGAGAVDPMKR